LFNFYLIGQTASTATTRNIHSMTAPTIEDFEKAIKAAGDGKKR